MEKVRLGPDGPLIGRVGLGGCPLGGHGWGAFDDREAIAAVRRAVELGVDHVDTADVYGLGRSEELIAEALGPDLDRVVLATKFGVRRGDDGRMVRDLSVAHLGRAIEASLRRLRVDCIPLYYAHWPDGRTPIEETMAELLRRRDAGQLRWIGLSNVSADLLERALTVGPVHAVQVQCSLIEPGLVAELLPVARRARVTVVTWGSLCQGMLTGKYDAASTFDEGDRRRRYDAFRGESLARNLGIAEAVCHAAARLGRSPAQVALRWVLDQPGIGVVLFGAKRPSQVEDNVGAAAGPLPAEVVDRLDEIARGAALAP